MAGVDFGDGLRSPKFWCLNIGLSLVVAAVVEPPLRDRLMHYIYHRVKPLVQQAFAFAATRFEDFRIACYDSQTGGYFRPHRDNTTAGTAHRVFAMSLNLNAGDYEGGYLRFPEFSPQLYRPGTGEAVIFSCSLVHEATEVTAGRRFVLLTFLYGEAQAKLRAAYERNAQPAPAPTR